VIYFLRDGGVTLGCGRSVDEACREAARINLMVGSAPFTVEEVKALIDVGAIQVREVHNVRSL